MRSITLREIIKLILDKIVVVVVIPFIAIAVAAFINYNVIKPTYTASTSMYVLNRQSNTLNYNDLTTGTLLIADYQQLALSGRVMSAAAVKAGIKNTREYSISVAAKSNTRIIQITVTGTDPVLSADYANAIADNLSTCIMEVMKVENISVIDRAGVPVNPSGPDKIKNIALTGVIGLALSIALVLLMDLSSSKIKTAEDVAEFLDLPVLAKIPQTRRRMT